MTFEEIYTKAIDEIKQDPVSYVWNNYIKSMMIRSLLLSQNQRWKMVNTLNTSQSVFTYCVLISVKLNMEPQLMPSCCRIITQLNLVIGKRWYSQIIAHFGCRQLIPIKENRIHIKDSKRLLDSLYDHSPVSLLGMAYEQIYKRLFLRRRNN